MSPKSMHWPDIPGMALWPWRRGVPLRIDIDHASPTGLPEEAEAEVQRRWAALRHENPRLHDGRILSVAALDADRGHVNATVGSFKHLAVQGDGLDLGVRLLGVKAVILARDAAGHEHVLLARRGTETRIYGGMWEVAPAGGIDPPPVGVASLSTSEVIATVRHEARDELGLALDVADARLLAIARDDTAHCYDFFCALTWPEIIDPRRGLICAASAEANDWEYLDTVWLPRREADQFDRDHAAAIVGPARAVLRWMGWTGLPE